jgi:hypothetical protein
MPYFANARADRTQTNFDCRRPAVTPHLACPTATRSAANGANLHFSSRRKTEVLKPATMFVRLTTLR